MTLQYWRSDKLLLRAMKASDLILFQAFDDEIARNVNELQLPQSPERQSKWFEGEAKGKIGDAFRFVAENEEGQPVGTIETFACNRRNGTFKYGIALLPEHRSKGYAQEMIETVLRFYFDELNYQKVTPHVYSFNPASIKLHEKMGFVQEGRLRSMIYSGGEYFDEIYYGMTKSEFKERYKAKE
ncbi:GNAT family protein [Paenibacillus sp. HB172176]|uniref:GNAT family N-acetyltransferase n=1 Tax=Paenibacillus sp. HB172176 TaxID=2493690 RepID=UPI00143B6D62|nr:GNAT family protein [Paenibacillus sp. HB172176]